MGKMTRKSKETMPTLKTILMNMVFAAGAVAGAAQEPSRTDINPALLYYQAFLAAPEPMSRADLDFLGTKEGRRWKLPERCEALASGSGSQFRLARLAARSKAPCDWGLDTSQGPGTLVPHLSRAKAVAQAGVLRVRWELQQGQQAEARDDLLAMLALGRSASRDGILVGALVQMAIEAITYNTLAANFGQFSPDTLRQLVEGINAAPARGTVAGCIPWEKVMCRDWLVARIQELQRSNLGDDAKAMAAFRDLFMAGQDSEQTNLWERVAHAAGGTTQGLVDLIRGLDPVSQRLAAISALPYGAFVKESKAFQAEIEAASNPLVPQQSSWLRACQKQFRIQVREAMIRAAVEYKLRGDAGFQGVTDPCGQGPFVLRRFIFQGVDRGFELTSAIDSVDAKSLIFVEKDGDPFLVDGPHVGEAVK